MSAFDSESLFTAFDQVGWNAGQAPTIDDAYQQLPDETDTDKVRRLQLENSRLKRIVHLLIPPKPIKESESGPLCQLNFYHNTLSRHHKDSLIKLVTDFIDEAENGREMDLFDPLPNQKSAVGLPTHGEEYDEFKIIQSVQIFPNGYYIDRIGEPLGPFDPIDAHWTLPEYQPLYRDILTENPDDDGVKIEATKKKMSKCCFNCGSDAHGIKDCPDPRNPEAINKRKEEFNKQFGGTPRRGGPNIRLFEAGDGHGNNKKFAAFKPGIVSEELRKACGFKDKEVPSWIYQMRKYGYPPGWLEESIVRESGVSVQEEGEVNEISLTVNKENRKLVGIDVSKVVSYSGYNAPLDTDIPDNCGRDIPKFNKKDDREIFIEKYCVRNKCQRIDRKRKITEDDDQSESKKAKCEDTDGEVEKIEADEEEVVVKQEEEEEEEFIPGWEKRESSENDLAEISHKGLPNRNKWQSGIVAFAHDAYQPSETKTGAYSKLKTTLKKKNS